MVCYLQTKDQLGILHKHMAINLDAGCALLPNLILTEALCQRLLCKGKWRSLTLVIAAKQINIVPTRTSVFISFIILESKCLIVLELLLCLLCDSTQV